MRTKRGQRPLTFGPKESLNDRMKKIDAYDWDDNQPLGRVDTRTYGHGRATTRPGGTRAGAATIAGSSQGGSSPKIPVTRSPMSRKVELFEDRRNEYEYTYGTAAPVGEVVVFF